jgi:triphosphatase
MNTKALEPREIELKLRFPPEAKTALQRHPALRSPGASDWEVRHEHTVYFDTPALVLAEMGFSLRIRRRGERRIQTLKSASSRDGVAASRREWEWPVDQDHPDLALLLETPFGKLHSTIAEGSLRSVCETRIERIVKQIRLGDDTVVEVVLDQGQVSSGNKIEAINELELELKQGTSGPIYRLALALLADIPLTLGMESKSERGQRLLTGSKPKAVGSVTMTLEKNIRVGTAFRRLVGAELGHILANQPAASMLDIEGIHEMRVGVRRLRSLLALFRRTLDPQGALTFDAGLKRLGQVLGAARDWDVFCTQILPEAESHGRIADSASQLRQGAETQRHAAHVMLQQALEQPGFTALSVGMAAWLDPASTSTPVLMTEEDQRPLRKLAPDLMDRLARKVTKRGGRRRKRSADQLHDLRKALKKLHYSAEYVAALYSEKPTKRFLRACKRLQKALGDSNDCTMVIRLAEKLCAAPREEMVPAVAAMVRWSEKRRDKALGNLPKAWTQFDDTPAFWR